MDELIKNQKEYAKLYHEQKRAYKLEKNRAEKQRVKDKKDIIIYYKIS